jgi:hypothetical protein
MVDEIACYIIRGANRQNWPPRTNTAMMNLFLAHVAEEFADYFIVMQVDQAGWHRPKQLQVPENIRLIPQLPRSPELNPVGHIQGNRI